MGYGKKIYYDAKATLEERRALAEQAAAERQAQFYELCPRGREIREEMAQNSANAAKAVLRGGDVRGELEKLKARGAALREELSQLLSFHGFSKEELSPRYTCSLCQDTGVANGKTCSCLIDLQRKLAYEKLSLEVPLSECTFENFSLDYYKEDQQAFRQMSSIFQACREYASRFRKDSPSLLLKGGTGLGKTHLSLAIAGKALEKGYGVIYGAAQAFAVSLERERFEQTDPELEEDTQSQLISCDLLILDDLGMEFSSAYVNASLYYILDTRLLTKRPTIISTNLSLPELEKRYGERFVSRLSGHYGQMAFQGSDIRTQKRQARKSWKAPR